MGDIDIENELKWLIIILIALVFNAHIGPGVAIFAGIFVWLTIKA